MSGEKDILRAICRLITAGHVHASDYGWSFFLIAIDELVSRK